MVTFKFDYTCLYFTCFLQCPNKCCVKTAQLKLNTIYFSFKAYFQSGNTHKAQNEGKGQSRFTVEWTNQHGCSNKDLNCNIVLQYMCQPDTDTMKENTIRNGMSFEGVLICTPDRVVATHLGLVTTHLLYKNTRKITHFIHIFVFK